MALKELTLIYSGVFYLDPFTKCLKIKPPFECSTCDQLIVVLYDPTLTVGGTGVFKADIKEIYVSCKNYKYKIEFDDSIFVDPDRALRQCDIKSVCCAGCVIDYIDSFITDFSNNSGLLGSLLLANFNTTIDQEIQINSSKYFIEEILVTDASIELDTAVGGFYADTGKTTPIVDDTAVYTGLVVPSDALAFSLVATPADVTAAFTNKIMTEDKLYLSLTTPQGAAATANVYVFGRRLD